MARKRSGRHPPQAEEGFEQMPRPSTPALGRQHPNRGLPATSRAAQLARPDMDLVHQAGHVFRRRQAIDAVTQVENMRELA